MVLGRVSSNTSAHIYNRPGSRKPKPTLAGIGKAPTRTRALSSTQHAAKAVKVTMAARRASVARARQRDASGLPLKLEPSAPVVNEEPEDGMSANPIPDEPMSADPTPAEPAPQPAPQLAPQPAPQPVSQPAPQSASDNDTPSTSSQPVPVRDLKLLMISENGRPQARVPIVLPHPSFAPNLHMEMEDGTIIPTLYIQDRLVKMLPRIHMVCNYFQPYPSIPSPFAREASDDAPASGVRETFAWGVPYIINGHDSEGRLGETLRPWQPDACLAIRKRGGGENATFRVMAINYTVYAAFFIHFPRRFRITTSCQIEQAMKTTTRPSANSEEETTGEPGEEEEEEEIEFENDHGSDASSASEVSYAAAFEVGEHLHLPVMALDIPDPDSWQLVHDRLHTPQMKWQPALLGLKVTEAYSPDHAQAALALKSVTELINIIKTIHNVWLNIHALGLDNDAMWKELNSAYRVVLGSILRRADKVVASNA